MISNQPQSDRPGESREHGRGPDLGETGGRMKEHMRSVAADAREKGRSVIDRQKHQIAETLRHVSEALGRASKKLHEEHDDAVANFTDAVCERVEGTAEYVDRVEVTEMIDQVESFARRQPQIFLGGMFLAGLAAARFLKASPPSAHRHITGPQRTHGGVPSRGPGGMAGSSTRQQGIGGAPSTGPAVTPPTGSTFPSSGEPIPGPRPSEPARSQSGIGGSSRSQESRPGTPETSPEMTPGSGSHQHESREKQHQPEQQRRHEGRGGES